MPEIYFIGDANAYLQTVTAVKQAFDNLPCHSSEAILVETHTESKDTKGNPKPFVRIEVSVEVSNEDLLALGNHFLKVIDVSIRNGHGVMDFREKGQKFNCFPAEPLLDGYHG